MAENNASAGTSNLGPRMTLTLSSRPLVDVHKFGNGRMNERRTYSKKTYPAIASQSGLVEAGKLRDKTKQFDLHAD